MTQDEIKELSRKIGSKRCELVIIISKLNYMKHGKHRKSLPRAFKEYREARNDYLRMLQKNNSSIRGMLDLANVATIASSAWADYDSLSAEYWRLKAEKRSLRSEIADMKYKIPLCDRRKVLNAN